MLSKLLKITQIKAGVLSLLNAKLDIQPKVNPLINNETTKT